MTEASLKNKRLAILRLLSRQAMVILVAMLMVGVANLLKKPEFIFPELAALTIGSLLIVKRVWYVNRWQIVLLITSAALIGTVLYLYSPFYGLVNIAIGFASVAALLILFRSSLYPALSACLLPLVLNEATWLYPLAVFLLSLLLVTLQWTMEKIGLRTPLPFRPTERTPRERTLRALAMLPFILAVAMFATLTQQNFFILPPLIVLFVEFSRPEAGLRKAPLHIIALMAIAALLGNFGKLFLEPVLGISPVLSIGITLVLLLTVFGLTKRNFAPAAAIAVLPQILKQENAYLFPLEVTLATALFIALALFLFRKKTSYTRGND